jgi:peptide/nickel transport system permease protein
MNRLTIIGVVIVVVLVVIALFAPWIAQYDVGATDIGLRYLPPSAAHWFGTDSTGRDIFSRVVFGARISLQVGIIVVVVSAFVGTIIGAIAGYYGGWLDRLISGYVFNVFLAFPRFVVSDRDGRISRRWFEQTDLRAVHHRMGRICPTHSRPGVEGARI